MQRGNVESNMVCRTFTTSNSKVRFCDCPKYMAYNPLSCQCEPAEQCGNSSKVGLLLYRKYLIIVGIRYPTRKALKLLIAKSIQFLGILSKWNEVYGRKMLLFKF